MRLQTSTKTYLAHMYGHQKVNKASKLQKNSKLKEGKTNK
jgi:hypothetical protein